MNTATANTQAISFLQNAPLAILAVDDEGRLAFANEQATVLFGYPAAEMIGRPVEMLIPPSFRTGHHGLLRDYFREPRGRVMGVGREVSAVDRSGRQFPVEIGLTPVRTAEGIFVVAAVADITVRKRMEREETAARLVQEAMLPRAFPQTAEFQIGGATRFAQAAGGDFLDCVLSRPNEAMLMIGDASGHGFASALVAVAAKSYLRAFSRLDGDLDDLLGRVNRLLVEELVEGRFVTLFVGRLLPDRRLFRYAGAGHVGYIVSRSGEVKSQLVSTGPPLGWLGDATYEVAEVAVQPGDSVLLLTDGIEESFDGEGRQFGRARIFEAMARYSDQDPTSQAQGLLETVARFTGGEQHDDMTVLIARLL
jgi:PAS domain S-box-containing protein